MFAIFFPYQALCVATPCDWRVWRGDVGKQEISAKRRRGWVGQGGEGDPEILGGKISAKGGKWELGGEISASRRGITPYHYGDGDMERLCVSGEYHQRLCIEY